MHSSLGQTALGEDASPAMIKISGKSEKGMKRIFLRVTDTIRHHDVIVNSQFASPTTAVDKNKPLNVGNGHLQAMV